MVAKSTSTEGHSMVEEKKEKKPICFVIMPISDHPDYDSGHFNRVYNHIFKPAIEQAGYHPFRADDETKSNNIVSDIIKRIIESDIVICDISTRNANVMYELGIRHAYDKPVVLVKDKITDNIFDIQGIRYVEYDSRLRIDNVCLDVEKIKKSILSHKNDSLESYSVMKLAMISSSAKLPERDGITGETRIILNTLKSLDDKIKNITINNQVELYEENEFVKKVNIDNEAFSVGDTVYDNERDELGTILKINIKRREMLIRRTDSRLVRYSFKQLVDSRITTVPF